MGSVTSAALTLKSATLARILLTYSPQARELYYRPHAVAALEALAEVRVKATAEPYDSDALVAAARDCDIIVADRVARGDAAVFASLPSLVAFVRGAMDIRNIDVAAASAHGVLVTHASAGFVASVSEWIVGVMIDLARHITESSESYRAGRAPAIRMGSELKGATLGVIGYGQIGRYLSELGLALGMRVAVSDPHAKVTNAALRQVELPQLLADADHVVCLAVASRETENLMDDAAFARMKPSSYFVNASRGELVDEGALLRALDAGRIAGCALDVGRAPDQMPSPALARHPKVIATPHVGGLTPQSADHQALETVAQVAEILAGRIPVGAVNPAAATRLPRS